MTQRKLIAAYNPVGVTRKPADHRFYDATALAAIIAAGGGIKTGNVRIEVWDDKTQKHVRRSVPRKIALTMRLESVAQVVDLESQFSQKPSASTVAARMHAIESAGRAMLRAFGYLKGRELRALKVLTTGEIPPALGTPLRAQAQVFGPRQRSYGKIFPNYHPLRWRHSADAEADYVDYLPESIVRRSVAAVALLTGLAARAKKRERKKLNPSRQRHKADPAFSFFIEGMCQIWIDIFGRVPSTSIAAPESKTSGAAGGPFIRFIEAAAAPLGIKKSKASIRWAVRNWRDQNLPKSDSAIWNVR